MGEPPLFVCSCHKGSIAPDWGASSRRSLEEPDKSVLPDILQRYSAAQNAHDIEALVACFAPDAVVRDEGKDIIGMQAIRTWKIETSAKYRITAEPLESRAEADRTIVVVMVSVHSPAARRS